MLYYWDESAVLSVWRLPFVERSLMFGFESVLEGILIIFMLWFSFLSQSKIFMYCLISIFSGIGIHFLGLLEFFGV